VEHVGDVAGGPGSHGVGAAIFDRFFFFFFFKKLLAIPASSNEDTYSRATA